MLWICRTPELTPDELSACLPRLSPARQQRIRALRHPAAAAELAAAELLLRRALWCEYGMDALPEIALGPKGKPSFPARPELQFNLSHCRRAVACALDTAPCGVDVQDYRRLGRRDFSQQRSGGASSRRRTNQSSGRCFSASGRSRRPGARPAALAFCTSLTKPSSARRARPGRQGSGSSKAWTWASTPCPCAPTGAFRSGSWTT